MRLNRRISTSIAAQVGMALASLILSGATFAGVVTGLPPIQPLGAGAQKAPSTPASGTTATSTTGSSATAGTTSSSRKVPAISPAAAARIASAQVWQQSIATPPEGKESAETKALARQSLVASRVLDRTLPVIGGADGTVTSLAGRPVLVCSPLHTCIIELPEGVKPVTTVGVSRSEWNVQQAVVGKQPEIFLSPKFQGLHQNLVVAATRDGIPVNYEIRLVSDARRYVPALKIADSGGEFRSWSAEPVSSVASHAVAGHKIEAPHVLPLPNIRLDHVDLHWSIHCGGGGWFSSSDCAPIRPLRVYDDGTHTFIDMPQGLASHGGFPILQARNASGHLIGVNTQIRGNTYVVDSVPAEIQLRLGAEVVVIKKEER
ncbi:TrbG/VirB9 family P-type conjugative transfer protein [Acidithiobacillus sp.]|uniref:TrbG/VirB9 family P-type conjugative transfer protein n=1 Tax=Acidithiobacillus sp. TaxID=1872118 RepID=UPI003D032384